MVLLSGEVVSPIELLLPPCAIPRPGDRVLCYVNGRRLCGELLGHTHLSAPMIKFDTGLANAVDTFDMIRLEDPMLRVGPNWERLPDAARITRPSPQHRDALERLLDRTPPAGISHMELVNEIWSRGHEVFLIDGTIRDVLAERDPVSIELATTMPIDRLHALARSMYEVGNDLGEIDRLRGRLRIGGAEGTPEPAINIRVFPWDNLGSNSPVFGSSFERDTGYRDFACNCVYYDPVNRVLIDPTGTGVEDAKEHRLRTVYDRTLHSKHALGLMALRAAILQAIGYTAVDESKGCMDELGKLLGSLTTVDVVTEVKLLLAGEIPVAEKETVLKTLYETVSLMAGPEFSNRMIVDHTGELLS